jgi:S1-C subfamily serine protease
VDHGQAAAFGRPPGTDGAFSARAERAAEPTVRLAAPPPTALAAAFGKPTGSQDLLQRPPSFGHNGLNGHGGGQGGGPGGGAVDGTGAQAAQAPDFWDGSVSDPWRNPTAQAALAAPALTEPDDSATSPSMTGARLSAREVLFGRRVEPRALAVLAAVVLLIAAVGGLIGRLTADAGGALTGPDVTLAQVGPVGDRPPGSIADVAAHVVPSVVSIEIRVGQQGGTGSGVVIDGGGYIVTNNHVVSLAANSPDAVMTAVFSDGTRAAARIVGRDPKTDLAVVKVAVSNPIVAQLGRSADLRVGDSVIAIGSPLGLAGTVTTGIVSAVDRPVRLDGEGSDTNAVIDAVQTDAAINPGNSGGALTDSRGAVVGINTAIRTLGGSASSGSEGGSIGLGFAIPIDDATKIAQQLIRTGQVKHADLGVNAKSVTDNTTDGAQVQNVQEGGAAARAGITEGDVITKLADRTVGSADELVVAVRQRTIGDQVEVNLVRQGRPLTLRVTLASD